MFLSVCSLFSVYPLCCCLYVFICSVPCFQSTPFVVVSTFWSVPFLVFSLPLHCSLYVLICSVPCFQSTLLLLSVRFDLFRSLFSVYPLCCSLYVLICSVPCFPSTPFTVVCTFWSVLFLWHNLPYGRCSSLLSEITGRAWLSSKFEV